MNLRHHLSSTLFLLAISAAPAGASTITYNILFGGSDAPTQGTFTWNNVTDTFSNFTVTWNGTTFNLTASANSPTISPTDTCTGGATGAIAAFDLLNPPCTGSDPTTNTVWYGSGSTIFEVTDNFNAKSGWTCIETGDSDCSGNAVAPGGILGIDPVPEPTTLALVLMGAGFVMRKRLVWLRDAVLDYRKA
jgi:hypothetical protein